METVKIAGVKRDAFGKKESKAVRKEGMVPCVIYGNGEKTIHFAVDARALKPLIYTPQSYLVEFEIDGKKEMGVMREVQFHPVKDTVLHVDFFHVIPGKPIAIDVPVRLSGNFNLYVRVDLVYSQLLAQDVLHRRTLYNFLK